MKAISLWQPWATAIALGSKRIETRHWPTRYRGTIAIHAAKRFVRSEMEDIADHEMWQAALHWSPYEHDPLPAFLPFGAIVATATLVDCRPSESFTLEELDTSHASPTHPNSTFHHWRERDMGNFTPGRYGWIFANITPLPSPVPFKGAQGLFDVPAFLLTASPAGAREALDDLIFKFAPSSRSQEQLPLF